MSQTDQPLQLLPLESVLTYVENLNNYLSSQKTLLDQLRKLPTQVIYKQHYQLKQLINEGGLGLIYQAVDTTTGQAVIFKVQKLSLNMDPHADYMWLSEYQLHRLATAWLPESPQLLDAFGLLIQDHVYGVLVLEMLENSGDYELAKLMHQLGPDQFQLTYVFFAKAMIALCQQVQLLHQHHFFHMDIKLDNLLCTRLSKYSWRIGLSDFGLSCQDLVKTGFRCSARGAYAPPEWKTDTGTFIQGHMNQTQHLLAGEIYMIGQTVRRTLEDLLRYFELPMGQSEQQDRVVHLLETIDAIAQHKMLITNWQKRPIESLTVIIRLCQQILDILIPHTT